jgi:hypothetical protein
MGKYESPNDDVKDKILLKAGMRGRTKPSSSVDASVGIVGLVIDAVNEAGSTETMLLRIKGIETRERLRKDQGGGPGDIGLDSSYLARGVRGACSSSRERVVGEGVLNMGTLLALPLPNTVFLMDPLRFSSFGPGLRPLRPPPMV